MTGMPRLTTSRTMITVLAAALAVLVLGVGVVAFTRGHGSRSEPVAVETTTSAAVTSPASPRVSRLFPQSSAPEMAGVLEVTGPECDSAVINGDLLFPNSGARIIDCQSGWAVMAGAGSGDPYWVAYSDGRWRRVADVSMYLGTCPAEAIARGAPAWMAEKHLGSCSPGVRPGRGAPMSAPTPAPTPARTSAATTSSPPPASPTRTSVRTRTPAEDPTSSATSSRQTSVTTPTFAPTSTTPPSTAADDAPAPAGQ